MKILRSRRKVLRSWKEAQFRMEWTSFHRGIWGAAFDFLKTIKTCSSLSDISKVLSTSDEIDKTVESATEESSDDSK